MGRGVLDRARILTHKLTEFINMYRGETDRIRKALPPPPPMSHTRQQQQQADRSFGEFLQAASDGQLEEVLSTCRADFACCTL